MTLNERVTEDIKTAMRAKDTLRLETLRMIRAQLLEKQVEKRPSGEVTPEDEVAILLSASKKRKEAIEIYLQAGRTDLANQETQELAIIQEYLPKQMSESEVAENINTIVQRVGATTMKDMGRVMAEVMKELKGKADGKTIQELVRKSLKG